MAVKDVEFMNTLEYWQEELEKCETQKRCMDEWNLHNWLDLPKGVQWVIARGLSETENNISEAKKFIKRFEIMNETEKKHL